MADEPDPGLQKAIEHYGAKSDLARALGITAQSVNGWRKIPVSHVLTLERLTGIPRHVQRPDIYPPPATPSDPKSERVA